VLIVLETLVGELYSLRTTCVPRGVLHFGEFFGLEANFW
jgi:hypothetical protein